MQSPLSLTLCLLPSTSIVFLSPSLPPYLPHLSLTLYSSILPRSLPPLPPSLPAFLPPIHLRPFLSLFASDKSNPCVLMSSQLLNHGIKVTTVCPSDVNTSGRREAEAARRNENEDTPSDSVAEPLSCRRYIYCVQC